MATNPVWQIRERMAEVQALLQHDHAECGKHTAADVVAKGDVRCRLLSAEYAAGRMNVAR
jgi:hypothetical protein